MKKIKCSVDIGSSNFTCVVGRYDTETKHIEILAANQIRCDAIHRGVIREMGKASDSMRKILEMTQEQAGEDVSKIIVAVRGEDISTEIFEGEVMVEDVVHKLITEHDISNVINDALKKKRPDEKEVFLYIPLDFAIDGQWGRKNPLHMYGSRLTTKLIVFSRNYGENRNIETLVHKAGYDIELPILHGLAVLSEDLVYQQEKEENCILIDFSGWNMGFVVYINELMFACKELYNVGSSYITRDISQALKIHTDDSEFIKREYCYAKKSLINNDERIPIRSKEKETTLSELAMITSARLEEMFGKLQKEIDDYLHYISAGGIIISGGGSKLKGCVEAFEDFFELPCRLASLHNISGKEEIITDPSFFTAIAAIRYEYFLHKLEQKAGLFSKLKKIIFG